MKGLSFDTLRKLLIGCIIICLGAGILIAQGSGTPSTLRVLVDASNNLLVSSSALSGAATSCVFANCRLRTDASGNLVITDGSGAGFAPADATYITQTPSSGLSNEQALSALSSGILRGATTTGVITSLGDILPSANGGTANAFFTVSGPASTVKTFTFPNASSNVLTDNATVTAAQGGTGLSTYAVGDLIFASATTPTLSKLADVAVGQVLVSGGVNTAPAYSANPTATSWGFASSLGTIAASSDGIFKLLNNAGTDFNRLQFGGTTSSFGAIKRNGTGFDFRTADDSAYVTARADTFNFVTSITRAGVLTISATSPSNISACGGGTAPTFVWTNGTASFEILTGSSTPVSTCTWTMPTAANRWVCSVVDITTQSTNVFLQKMTASSTTSVTITNYNTAGTATAVVASDHLLVQCMGG